MNRQDRKEDIMKCPECKEEMALIDNTTFLNNSIINQLFGFKPSHYGCFDCNIVVPINREVKQC